MKPKSYLPQTFMAAAALLLLGGMGAYWPRWVDAAPGNSAFANMSIIGDAITYQGYLTDGDDIPLTGPFTMQFAIYNAQSNGKLLWESGDLQIEVNGGLFEARLDITKDIFNGEELWVTQTINGETLTPRQEILPVPMAHTLRPGAIIKGTANALPNNYLVDVQMNNDAFAFNRGAIFGQTTTGNAIQGLANNGRAVYGQTQDGYAIYGFDGGSDANRGYAGYFYSTNGIGVYGYSNGDRSHPNILAPGVYGQSNQGVGVYGRGDTSNSFTFYNEGGYFEGGKGLYALGTDSAGEQGYGARIFSNNYRGMYVRGSGSSVDAYFGGSGGISTNGVIDRSARSQSLVTNKGEAAIEPGDLVAMVGVEPSPENDEPMLAVAKVDANNARAVIGVAVEAMTIQTVVSEDNTERIDFVPTPGSIEPDRYLVIVTSGLAPAVNLSSFDSEISAASSPSWQIGDRIHLSTGNRTERIGGQEDRIWIGKVAGPIDQEHGTVPLFIDID